MDIQRDEAFEEAYSKICNPIIARPYPHNQHGEYIYKEIHEAHLMWQEAQAVLAWVDYSKQSPRIDGRYQVFIAGEQLTADYETPFGFSSAEDGTALIQELISHWSLLPEAPMQEQDHG